VPATELVHAANRPLRLAAEAPARALGVKLVVVEVPYEVKEYVDAVRGPDRDRRFGQSMLLRADHVVE
jgi:hypothetical protein